MGLRNVHVFLIFIHYILLQEADVRNLNPYLSGKRLPVVAKKSPAWRDM